MDIDNHAPQSTSGSSMGEGQNILNIDDYAADEDYMYVTVSEEGVVTVKANTLDSQDISHVDSIIGRDNRAETLVISTHKAMKIDGRGGQDVIFLSAECKIKEGEAEECEPIEIIIHHQDVVMEFTPQGNDSAQKLERKVLCKVPSGESGQSTIVLSPVGERNFSHCDSRTIMFPYTHENLNALKWGNISLELDKLQDPGAKHFIKHRLKSEKNWGIRAEGKDGNNFTVNVLTYEHSCNLFPEVRLEDSTIVPYPYEYEKEDTLTPYIYYPPPHSPSGSNLTLGNAQSSAYTRMNEAFGIPILAGALVGAAALGAAVFLWRCYSQGNHKLKNEELTQFLEGMEIEMRGIDWHQFPVEKAELMDAMNMAKERLSKGEHSDSILRKYMQDAEKTMQEQRKTLNSPRFFIFSNKTPGNSALKKLSTSRPTAV